MRHLALAGILLASMAAVDHASSWYNTDCNGCQLSEAKGGVDVNSFGLTWTPNPNPAPGQGHGHGTCLPKSIGPGCDETTCKVNGTLNVVNNAGYEIHVSWNGESGGIDVLAGNTGHFSSGSKQLLCDMKKDIDIVEKSTGVKKAYWTWDCSDCVGTGDPE